MPEVQTVQPQKAVYYPHIEFGSTAWVKNALLYWEGIVRARPMDTSAHDEPEIQQLLDKGLIEEIAPDPWRHRALPELGRRLDEVVHAHGGRLPRCIPGVRTPRGTSPEREERVRAEIIEAFREYPLARKAFLETPDQARALFFTAWADKSAQEKQYSPITDDPIFHVITTYLQNDQITNDPKTLDESNGASIAMLCLPSPSLEAIAQLPVSRLLEIRDKYAAQRRHFRAKVQAQLQAIAELPTPEAINENLEGFRHEIEDDLGAAREATENAKVKERWTLLGISAPASLAAGVSMAATASPLLGPVGGAGTLALAVTSWFMRSRKGEGQKSHYLLSLDSAVKSQWGGFNRALHDFAPGSKGHSS
jgi:hypothetical protein